MEQSSNRQAREVVSEHGGGGGQGQEELGTSEADSVLKEVDPERKTFVLNFSVGSSENATEQGGGRPGSGGKLRKKKEKKEVAQTGIVHSFQTCLVQREGLHKRSQGSVSFEGRYMVL